MLTRTIQLIACCLLLNFTVGIAHADLDFYLRDLNVSAQADIGGYKAQLGARFGTSRSELDVVFGTVHSPAEVAVVLWLGEQAHKPIGTVLQVYRSERSQGWGAMAKSLGIKPGSPAFHALKNGDLQLSLESPGRNSKSNAKSNKKDKTKSKQKHS